MNYKVNLGLLDYRTRFDATQAEMAKAMGMPFRTYQDLEAGKVAFRDVHQAALEMGLLRLAVEKDMADRLPRDLLLVVKSIAEKHAEISAILDKKLRLRDDDGRDTTDELLNAKREAIEADRDMLKEIVRPDR